MPLTRPLWFALCALLPGAVQSAGGPPCPAQPAQCEISAPLYNFGRHPMTASSAPIRTQGSISLTCTKLIQQGFPVNVDIELQGLPPRPSRALRGHEGEDLTYALFLEPALTRAWGDGSSGTYAILDNIELRGNDRVLSRTYVLYGRVDGGQQGSPGRYLGSIASRLRYTVSCP